MAPKKFWRQILTRKTKYNNRIALHDWNSYLKKLYDSPNVINNFETLLTIEEVFSLEDIKVGVKRLVNGKAKDIEGYQAEISFAALWTLERLSIRYLEITFGIG